MTRAEAAALLERAGVAYDARDVEVLVRVAEVWPEKDDAPADRA